MKEKIFLSSLQRLLCFIGLLYGITAYAQTNPWKNCDFAVDGVFYDITSPTTVKVTYKSFAKDSYGYYPVSGFTGDVVIPPKVTYDSKEYDVTAIGTYAFRESAATSVTLPDNILTIAENGFYDSRQLTSVTLPNSLTTIGYSAFNGCIKLSSIEVPEGVTTLGNNCFSGCSALTSASLPTSLKTIPDYAFNNCTGLTSITFKEGVTTIGNSAFYGCAGLTSIVIPDGVMAIGNSAFAYCSSLAAVTIPNSVTSIGYGVFSNTPWEMSQPEGIVYIGKVAYKYNGTMPENTQIVLKAGTTGIGSSAFSNCTGLTAISIPNSVEDIGGGAFFGCTGLTTISIPSSVTAIGNNAFKGCSGLTTVSIGNGKMSIGDGAFYDCTGLTNVANVGTLGYTSFAGCTSLETLSMSEYAESIGTYAFSGCTDLVSIFLNDGLTTIGDYAFNNCSSLKSIIIPRSVESIDWHTFNGCKSLTSATIHCKKVGGWLSYKSSLQEVILVDGVTEIDGQAFSNCSRLTSVTIPNSVESVGPSAFYGTAWYNSLPNGLVYIGKAVYKYKGAMPANTIVELKEGTKSITSSAFYDCAGLVSITIPQSVTNISFGYTGTNTFAGCTGLASIKVEEGNTIYDSRDNCNAIIDSETNTLLQGCKGTVIPSSVTSIKSSAFSGCIGLTSITIPGNVKTIGGWAFHDCKGLIDVTIQDGVETIGSIAFADCSALTTISIPGSVTAIGSSAFSNCDKLVSVTVGMELPVNIEAYTFSNRKNATLYVPYGSKAAYEAAEYWKEFKEIVEAPTVYKLYGTNLEALSGSQAHLPIELINKSEVKLCQFDLHLPVGVTVATKSNGKLDAKLTERTESHSISSQRLSNGDYRFVVSSLDNESFAGNSGTLMEITLDVAATMEAGEYTVKVLNAELSVPDGNDLMVVSPADTESKLTVKSYTPGDVNSDGSVSVTDVGCAINYILEQVPSVFVFEAADMNGDKSVSVTDVGMIINLILNEGVSGSRGMAEEKVNNDNHFSPNLSLQATAEGYELQLEDKDALIGFQFDVELGDGATINGVQLNEAADSDHLLTYRRLNNGKWRVVCYSPTNSTFTADDTALLTISVVGNASERYFTGNAGTATLGSVAHFSDIRLTTAGLDELRPAALVSMPTGIANVKQDMKMSVQGKTLCITSDRDITLRLLTIGGNVYRILHVHRGQNNFDDLRAGIYMINNQKVIVR